MNTKEAILSHTAHLLAYEGVAGTSMRKVAAAVNREASVIYSHFADKKALLLATRIYITMHIDRKMKEMPYGANAHEQLKNNIEFQFKHREMVVALLQYFMAVREDFQKNDYGYIPSRAYQHMTDIIARGIAEGTYHSESIEFDAKIVTHLINGFLMEYFDHDLNDQESETLVNQLCTFIERSLAREAAPVC